MKVFAGSDFNPPADASYKNLVWENLPDFVFHGYTPALVIKTIINDKFVTKLNRHDIIKRTDHIKIVQMDFC